MKHLKLLLMCVFCFPFLGMDTMPKPEQQPVRIRKTAIRPTMKQLIQLKESELQRINSDLKTEIATFE